MMVSRGYAWRVSSIIGDQVQIIRPGFQEPIFDAAILSLNIPLLGRLCPLYMPRILVPRHHKNYYVYCGSDGSTRG